MTKRRLKKNDDIKRIKLVDASGRKNFFVGEIDDYSEEELQLILANIQQQVNQIKQEYYSSNTLIERITRRKFTDIMKEKKQEVTKRMQSKIADIEITNIIEKQKNK